MSISKTVSLLTLTLFTTSIFTAQRLRQTAATCARAHMTRGAAHAAAPSLTREATQPKRTVNGYIIAFEKYKLLCNLRKSLDKKLEAPTEQLIDELEERHVVIVDDIKEDEQDPYFSQSVEKEKKSARDLKKTIRRLQNKEPVKPKDIHRWLRKDWQWFTVN